MAADGTPWETCSNADSDSEGQEGPGSLHFYQPPPGAAAAGPQTSSEG